MFSMVKSFDLVDVFFLKLKRGRANLSDMVSVGWFTCEHSLCHSIRVTSVSKPQCRVTSSPCWTVRSITDALERLSSHTPVNILCFSVIYNQLNQSKHVRWQRSPPQNFKKSFQIEVNMRNTHWGKKTEVTTFTYIKTGQERHTACPSLWLRG